MKATALVLVIACGHVAPTPGASDGDGAPGTDGSQPDPGSGGGIHDAGGGSSGADADVDVVYRSGTRIKSKYLTTPDGAKVFIGNYDSERGEDCSMSPFQTTSDGVVRCLPTIALISSPFFSDSACTSPIALTAACGDSAALPKYIATVDFPCSRQRLGPIFRTSRLSITNYYFKSGSNCLQQPETTLLIFAPDGPEIPPGAFAPATISVE